MDTQLIHLKVGDKFIFGNSPYIFIFTGKPNQIGHYQAVAEADESVDIYLPGDTIVSFVY